MYIMVKSITWVMSGPEWILRLEMPSIGFPSNTDLIPILKALSSSTQTILTTWKIYVKKLNTFWLVSWPHLASPLQQGHKPQHEAASPSEPSSPPPCCQGGPAIAINHPHNRGNFTVTWTMSPSSTIELLAVKLAVDFKAPLNTTKLAPVTIRSLFCMLIACVW